MLTFLLGPTLRCCPSRAGEGCGLEGSLPSTEGWHVTNWLCGSVHSSQGGFGGCSDLCLSQKSRRRACPPGVLIMRYDNQRNSAKKKNRLSHPCPKHRLGVVPPAPLVLERRFSGKAQRHVSLQTSVGCSMPRGSVGGQPVQGLNALCWVRVPPRSVPLGRSLLQPSLKNSLFWLKQHHSGCGPSWDGLDGQPGARSLNKASVFKQTSWSHNACMGKDWMPE